MGAAFSRSFVAAAAVALVASGTALAAVLGVSSESLTNWTSASGVPVSTCTLTASADSYVNQDTLSQGTNYGAATTVQVESSRALLVDTNKRGFVKFDVASCSIPSGAYVSLATLSVFLSTAPSLSRTWNIDRVTGSWTESGITWSNQPPATGSTSVTTGTTANVTLQAPVTSDVAGFVSGSATNNGWRFSDSLEGSVSVQNGQFNPREAASNPPTLVIRYYP
jgi:hypothetical protein